MIEHLNQQWHGYRRGHQRLSSTLELARDDQDLVDKLSDASGPLRPNEKCGSYLTTYPLPSGEFYVVARTWQDEDSPRSGSVVTQSLFVPIEKWSSIEDVRQVLRAHERNADREVPIAVLAPSAGWRPIQEEGLNELVEALFLEPENPIAVFGVESVELIAERLLESLWPVRRSNISLCTLALGPRSIAGRDFDLLFAPATSQPRFSKWSGRRILASSANEARHPWTAHVVHEIFCDANPSLQHLDQIGALDHGMESPNASLRLALRYRDLKQGSASSPRAILGMLDILRSLERNPWKAQEVPQLILNSIEISAQLDLETRWDYLTLLLRKLGQEAPLSVIRSLLEASGATVMADPELILATVEGKQEGELLPLFRISIAKALRQVNDSQFNNLLSTLRANTVIDLMEVDPALSASVTRSLSKAENKQLTVALAGIVETDERAARRISSGLSQGADSDAIAPLFESVSANVPTGILLSMFVSIYRNTDVYRPALAKLAVKYATREGVTGELCEIALKSGSKREADLIFRSIVNTDERLLWLVKSLSEQEERLNRLLVELLGRWSSAQIQSVVSNSTASKAIRRAVISTLPGSSKLLIKLLKIDAFARDKNLELLASVFAEISPSEKLPAAMTLAEELFSQGPARYPDIANTIFAEGDVRLLIRGMTDRTFAAKRIGQTLEFIANSKCVARFAQNIDFLSERLSQHRAGGFGRKGYSAWAAILRAASEKYPKKVARAADTSLEFALAHKKEPVGDLVSASFPIIHAALSKKSKKLDLPLNIFTAVLHASMELFGDIDHAKAARQALVESFMQSKWEPDQLLKAGYEAGALKSVLHETLQRKGGRRYLHKADTALAKQSTEPNTIIRQELKLALKRHI